MGGIAPVGDSELRQATVVNTLMVMSASISIGDTEYSDWPTVNPEQVRMLWSEAKLNRQQHLRAARRRRIFGRIDS